MGHDFHWAFAIQDDENITCMVWSKDNSYGEFCGYRQIVATGPGAAAGMIAAHEYIDNEYPGAMTHKAGYWFIPSDPGMSAINRVGEMKGIIGGTDAVTSCDSTKAGDSRPSFGHCVNGLEALESLAARVHLPALAHTAEICRLPFTLSSTLLPCSFPLPLALSSPPVHPRRSGHHR